MRDGAIDEVSIPNSGCESKSTQWRWEFALQRVSGCILLFALLLCCKLTLDCGEKFGFDNRIRADHQHQIVVKFMSVKI
ncbi:hypothetical protein VN12_22775 [Pirellula sp. SH-Sr6A]|nr:hypothetical protein VN12_22775 [Pirellula sp. SH-Sr6A]